MSFTVRISPLIIILIAASVCGCTGFSPFAPGTTIVPTIIPTPIPSTTQAPPTITPVNSLPTGSQITWELQGGFGQLVVDNRLGGEDVVVILAGIADPKTALAAVYVKGGDQCTVDGITDGQYVLYDMIGTNWNDKTNQFAHTSEYAKFNRTLTYYTTDTESKVFTVTLSGTGQGDTQSQQMKQGDVPAL